MKGWDLRSRNKHHNTNAEYQPQVFRTVSPRWLSSISASAKQLKIAYIVAAIMMGISIGAQMPLGNEGDQALAKNSSANSSKASVAKVASAPVSVSKNIASSTKRTAKTSAVHRTDTDTSDACGPVAEGDSCTDGDGYTAPAPTKSDVSGGDQDQFYIPGDFQHPQSSWGGYKLNGSSIDEGWHSVNGASSITITTSYNSGTWTFNFSSETTGTEATNKFEMIVGSVCKHSEYNEVYRPVFARFTNVADDTGRFVHSIWPSVDASDKIVANNKSGEDIRDGKTVDILIAEAPSEQQNGLSPGKYHVDFWQADKGTAVLEEQNPNAKVVKRLDFTVPTCAKPQPKGNLKAIRENNRPKLRATLSTSHVSATKFIVKQANGKTVKTITIPKNSQRSITIAAKHGMRYKLVAGGRTLDSVRV